MIVSVNELTALLSRALESICRVHRDFDEAASAITWLAQSGWDVIPQLVKDMDKLTATDYRCTPRFETFADTILVDLAGESLFTAGAMLTDIGMDRLVERGQCRMVIAGTLHQEAVLGYLSRYGTKHGACAFASWSNSSKIYIARKDNLRPFADIWSRDEPSQKQHSDGLMMQILFCDPLPTDGNKLPELLELVGSTDNMTQYLTSEKQEKNFTASWDKGISIDPANYRALEHIANEVLVPNSVASRRGAGD